MSSGNILVVEDDELIRRNLIEYLAGRVRVEVDGARDGVDALHHVLTRRYDVVILDMMMPKMSGGDFLDSLEAMLSDPSLNFPGDPPSIIVVTAATDDDLPREPFQKRYGKLVRGMFRKPVDFDALASEIEKNLDA
ncbi:MAG TPA: response regulator [Thermoanaerobaculia bacterium]